jgi:hypothetical protein
MSAAARKQMELMGWKQGQGLGKEGTGISSYVRVQKRDPKLQSGLGHEAGKSGSDNSDMGFDALLSSLSKKKVDKKLAIEDESSDSEVEAKAQQSSARGPTRPAAQSDAEVVATPSSSKTKKPKKRARTPESSSSSSDEEGDDAANAGSSQNILQWDDATLLKKCGGVRLGRAGRHRFFNGKLNRIDESHK